MTRWPLVGALLLAGCNVYAFNQYEVGGAQTDFCMPRQNLIPNIPWVPADGPSTPKGFSFQSCWQPELSKARCPTSFLQGADVGPLSSFTGWRWQDIRPNAFYRSIVADPNTKLEALNGGSLVVVSNNKLSQQWYIWKKSTAITEGAKPFLGDGDEVLAACKKVAVFMPGKEDRRNTVSCDRTFRTKDAAVTYHFENPDGGRVPAHVDQLDAAVAHQMDQWRCPKH